MVIRVIIIIGVVTIISSVFQVIVKGNVSSDFIGTLIGYYLINGFSNSNSPQDSKNIAQLKIIPAEKYGLFFVLISTVMFISFGWAIADGAGVSIAVRTVVYYVFLIAVCWGLGIVYRNFKLKQHKAKTQM
ncbi:hypothetical protein SPFL3102_02107 [Sporomusaceae bacterium FL31]|nr:hypothetical protein SPFL3101_03741 [Sporomusaceae bacterium FL31]GCE34296.1 hypothetical protein SPFL3102_02107 [Sporomusaceae bacterium]